MLQKIKEFESYLILEEKSKATVMKYTHDVTAFVQWLDGQQISKAVVQEYKQLLESEYVPKSVNSVLSSLNSFFGWINHPEYRVKSLKIQKNTFIEPNRELTKAEYDILLKTAYEQGKTRLYLVMQTICATGIRVSELAYITVDAVKTVLQALNAREKIVLFSFRASCVRCYSGTLGKRILKMELCLLPEKEIHLIGVISGQR